MGGQPQQFALRLLVDASWHPVAVRLRPLGDDAERLANLLSGEALGDLASIVPCIVTDDDASRFPELQSAWREAHCRTVPATSIAAVSAPMPSALPEGVSYLFVAAIPVAPGRPSPSKTGSRALALRLAQLVSTDADTREIEEVFRLDPTLSYHLLRLVNSPGVGVGRAISSFAQAILILGRNQLRRWLNLLLFAACQDDPRAPLLMARATLRARLLEVLAKAAGQDREGQERAFMAGMFSLLGEMFGMPLAEVLRPLRLDPSLAGALLDRTGDLGAMLTAVEADEQGEGGQLAGMLASLLPGEVDVDTLAIEAYGWTLALVRGVRGGGDD